jgi:hypothetical protein
MTRSLASVIVALGVSAVARAQESEPESKPAFDVYGGFEERFTTDIDGGGDFSLSRFGVGIGWQTDLGEQTVLALRGGLLYEGYDFSGASALVDPVLFGDAEPWEDIWSARLSLAVRHALDKEWTIHGGPTLQFSGESGANLEDTIDVGGFGGVIWQVSDALRLGLGVGVSTRIEDDVRVFPLFTVDWRISESWSLTTESGARRGVGGFSLGGLELVYRFTENWDAAIGGAYEYRRFRLDDEGIAPDGVGQDESIPAWLRVTWRPAATWDVTVWGGATFAGELRLDDSDGDTISEQDYDPAAMLGLSAQIRF